MFRAVMISFMFFACRSKSFEAEDDEDASIKLSIPAITIVLQIRYYRRSKKSKIMIHDRIIKLSTDQ